MKQYETVQTADRRMERISAYAYLMQERMRRQEKNGKKDRLDAEIRKLKGSSCTGATEGGTYGLRKRNSSGLHGYEKK